MTKILNLDKLQTKNDKSIVLNGKEHIMKTFTVKEYIYHMREAEKLTKLDGESIDTLGQGFDVTISILLNAFPTVKREELEALNMSQLDAIRAFAESTNDDQLADDTDDEGNAEGEKVAE